MAPNKNSSIFTEDWFLQSLVAMVNSEKFSFSITLTVKGLLISGTMINEKEYFSLLASEMKNSLKSSDDEIKELIESKFKGIGELIYDSSENATNKNKYLKNPAYIHLKDVKIAQPGSMPIPDEGSILWRGKINSIDGFTFGTLKGDLKIYTY